jgi:hypothetical protein
LKPLEWLLHPKPRWSMAHIAIGCGGIGPVRLDSDDRKAVRLNEPLGDGSAGAIELGRPVARLTQQDDTALGEAVEEFPECPIIDLRKGFGRLGDQFRQS